MKTWLSKTLLTLIINLFLITICFAAPSTVANSQAPFFLPPPPKVSAKAYVVEAFKTGKVIAAKNSNQRMAPASLTKMMTLFIISRELKNGTIRLTDEVPISKLAWKTGGSKMFVKVGDQIPVAKLIQGIIVDSGNDACIAMAEYIAGSQDAFVSLMNQQAKALGMNHTHFMDATGLPHPDHYSTPADLAILARALIKNFPEYYHWYKQKSFTYNGIKQYNRNRLLWRDKFVDGLKTGHTDAAGYCLVSSAKRNGMRLIAVVMKSPTDAARATNSRKLLTYGFRFFTTVKLYDANKTLAQPRVWKGRNQTVPLGVKDSIYVTIPNGRYKALSAKISIPKNITAPIAKGDEIGNLTIKLGDQVIIKQPLIALQADPKGSLWTRFKDTVSSSIHSFLKG